MFLCFPLVLHFLEQGDSLLKCNYDWVYQTLIEAKDLLETDEYPQGSFNCDRC